MAFVRANLANLLAVDDWLPDELAKPDPKYYRQYLLYCDPLDRFSIVSFVWGPGQKTPIHDHTVWGVVGVLRGAEYSESFSFDPEHGPVSLGMPTRLDTGDIESLSPATGDIHRVWNAHSDQTSISIHVYGGNIGCINRHVFTTDPPAVKPFVSSYSNAFVPNLWAS